MCTWRRKLLDTVALVKTLRTLPQNLIQGFKSLSDSPRDLYLVLVLKFLESYNYFTLSLLYVLYLTDEFSIKDQQAGTSYGIWGSLIFLYGVVLAGAIDYLGVKVCLVASFICSAVARLLLATTRSSGFAIFLLYVPGAMGYALGIPVLTIAVKRYTTEGNRGTAFALFYSVMNVGALITGFVFDFATQRLRHGLGNGGGGTVMSSAWSDGYRLLVLSGCVTSIIALGLTFFVNEKNMLLENGAEADAEASKGSTQLSAPAAKPAGQPRLVVAKDRLLQVCRDILGVLCMLEFWKFFTVTILTTNLRQLFRHYDATMPKYMQRAFGCSAPTGAVYSINPFMIIFLVPLVGALTTHINHFDMIHYGSYLYAASPFWMAAEQRLWAVIVFSVQLSLGESIWSPRWYDYSMSVAPEGKEGLFTALSSAPLFLAKLPTGLLSGWLLQSMCPPSVDCLNDVRDPTAPRCQGQDMWAVIGGITMTSPLLLFLLQRWVRPKARHPQLSAAMPPRLSDGTYVPLLTRESSDVRPEGVQLLPMQASLPVSKGIAAM